MRKRGQHILILLGLMVSFYVSRAQVIKISPDTLVYQKIDTTVLHLYVYYPVQFDESKKYPAIVFYHGGGWNNGSPKAFNRQCMYFASRGLIAITVEYRIFNTHGTSPFEASEDAKSAMRFVRANAQKLNINAEMIAAGGGSAGGHLAAVCGNIPGINSPKDNLNIEAMPNALVLFNPVLDTSKDGYGFRKMDGRYKELSPIENITKGAPPTIIMVGTNDKVLPVPTAKRYKALMEEIGSRCDLVLYEGEEHAFFSRKVEYFVATTFEADKFLKSLGYLEGKPTIYQQYAERLKRNNPQK